MHLLDIRDLEEVLRAGAAHAQDSALALAVLLLALEAADFGSAVLLFVLAVGIKSLATNLQESLRGDEGRGKECLHVFVRAHRVHFAACGDHAGKERHEGEEDGDGFHVVWLFGWLVLVFALIRESIWNFFAGGVTGNNLGKIESVYIGGSEQY